MIKLICPKTKSQELFCQKYWRAVRQKAIKSKDYIEEPHLFDYTSFNRVLLGVAYQTPKKYLGKLDLSFKLCEPSAEAYTTWRGVTDPSFYGLDILKDYFNKCKNIKPGETLYLKEFPYTSKQINEAKFFMSGFATDYVNILFEIEIPKGTPLFSDGIRKVIQRYSKYECVGTKRVKEGDMTYQHIKLKLLPREIQHTETKDMSFVDKCLSEVKILQRIFKK